MQGDREKEAGLAVSPLMDRSMKGGMTRSQVSPTPLHLHCTTLIAMPCTALCTSLAQSGT